MTHSSEPTTPSDPPRPHAVVYFDSWTEQLREVLDALTVPLLVRGWDIRWVAVQKRRAFPRPPIGRISEVLRQVVDPDSVVELVEPEGGFTTASYELVILAGQSRYLAASLAIRTLLKSHPEVVGGRNVVYLIACRNTWYSAAVEVCGLLRSAGACRVDVVAATHMARSSTATAATLRWLLSGRREPSLSADRGDVGHVELARVAEVGGRLSDSWSFPRDAAPVVPTLAAADLMIGTLLRAWARLIVSASQLGWAAFALALVASVPGLAAAIAVGLPTIGLAALVGGGCFTSAVRRLIYRRTTFGRSALEEVAFGG